MTRIGVDRLPATLIVPSDNEVRWIRAKPGRSPWGRAGGGGVAGHGAGTAMTTKRGVVADVRVPHPMLDEAGFVDALVARGRELGGFPTFTVDELARKAFAMVIFAKRCGKL